MEDLHTMNGYLATIYLSVTATAVTYALLKTQFRLDLPAYVMITLNIATGILRLPLFTTNHVEVSLVAYIALDLQWSMLYYFVFEMKKLEDKISSREIKEFVTRNRKRMYTQWFVWIFHFAINLPCAITVYYFKGQGEQYYANHISTVDNLLLTRLIARLIVDINMFSTFFLSFYFFIQQKCLILNSLGQNLSKINKCVIFFTFFSWILNIVASIATNFIFSYEFSSYNLNTPGYKVEYIYILSIRSITWTVCFTTFMGMLCLFYYQGVRFQKPIQNEDDNMDTLIDDDECNYSGVSASKVKLVFNGKSDKYKSSTSTQHYSNSTYDQKDSFIAKKQPKVRIGDSNTQGETIKIVQNNQCETESSYGSYTRPDSGSLFQTFLKNQVIQRTGSEIREKKPRKMSDGNTKKAPSPISNNIANNRNSNTSIQ